MSDAETAPLNPAGPSNTGPELDDSDSFNLPTPKSKTFLHVFILYGLSCFVSVAGLGCALAGYLITINAPLKESNDHHREDYESNFFGMQSIVVFLGINVLYTAFNIHLARHGIQQNFYAFNFVYDFLLWATLIAFGVLNMVLMLVDRRLCDGWDGNTEMYRKCDVWMFRLLVVELVAVNLGLLVAVIHFIIMIARCCTHSEALLKIREQVAEEEGVLMILIERRQRLLEETRALEASKPLPPVPAVHDGPESTEADVPHDLLETQEEQTEEDLIDMAAETPRISTESSDFTEFTSATSADAEERRDPEPPKASP